MNRPKPFPPDSYGRLMVLEVLEVLDKAYVARADRIGVRRLLSADQEVELARLRRRFHTPTSLAEEVDLLRELGGEDGYEGPPRSASAFFREQRKAIAKRYGVSYDVVTAAFAAGAKA